MNRTARHHRIVIRIIRTMCMLLAPLLLAAIAGGCSSEQKPEPGPGSEEKREVLVFAAASLRDALEELATAYEKENNVDIVFNFAGSNQLAQQAIATRGVDLFLSASAAWMDSVEKNGRVIAGTRHDLLSNTLVVIANASSTWTLDAPCALPALPFKNIAIGDPAAVPAGQYARKWMGGIVCDGDTLWKKIADRMVPTPDVRAAVGLVVADADMIGIVYKSDQLAFAGKTKILHEVKDGPKIRYVLAQMTEGAHAEDAKGFAGFLSSERAGGVFQKHGFIQLSATTQPTH